jgi:hypothetical protein
MDGVGEAYERLRGRQFTAPLRRMDDVRQISAFGLNLPGEGYSFGASAALCLG